MPKIGDIHDAAKRMATAAKVVAHGLRRPRAAAQYIGAELGPRLDDDGVRVRLTICESCEFMAMVEGERYCAACDCPTWQRSELTVKARMARAPCPLGKWPPLPA